MELNFITTMARRLHTQDEHDKVVIESAKTYWKLAQEGYKVDVNPDGEQNRSVGKDNYPDVIVWKPSNPGSDSGTATIIEEIETSDSVNDSEAEQWITYAGLGIKFILVVPKGSVVSVNEIIKRKKIGITELWHYYYDINKKIQFAKSW
jgi:hypothetical protein